MGIEHRIKEVDSAFARCPSCGCVEEFEADMLVDHLVSCFDCEEKYAPRNHPVSWEDFTKYCQDLKRRK